MVIDAVRLDAVFQALAHEARRDMLVRLAQGDRTVGELGTPLPMSTAAASKHVKILEAAGLIHRTVEGRRHVCRLDAANLEHATIWLSFGQMIEPDRAQPGPAVAVEPGGKIAKSKAGKKGLKSGRKKKR